ncbi:MAG: insulinase family protein [Flavobacteriales bacterium]|nr:insulinase family protein [Flavobacteriales bacterium]
MLDRTLQPNFGKIESIDLMEPKVRHLDNGIPVFSIDAGEQEVLKVELVFDAGTASSDKLLVASSTVKLLTEGTEKRSAQEIAEDMDFYGAHLQTEIGHDDGSLVLYTLSKHLKNTIGTLAETYAEANFPERDLETFLLKHKQELLVNEEKVGYLSARVFGTALFGEGHPYGRSAYSKDYEAVTRNDLVDFHAANLQGRIKYIFLAGKLDGDTIQLLNTYFGQTSRQPIPSTEVTVSPQDERTFHVEKAGAVQNAIKIGRVLFNRTHPDYIGMQILSTVLGGYFGSRLMDNIREDKGYTYGIRAGMVSLKHSGYFTISTEVGSDVCAPALTEIYREIERLRKELIPLHELELVRNYMLGSVLKSIDGPFHISEKWKGYIQYGLGMDAHHDLVKQIRTITSERLRELANQYLQPNDLVQVTAGSKFQD